MADKEYIPLMVDKDIIIELGQKGFWHADSPVLTELQKVLDKAYIKIKNKPQKRYIVKQSITGSQVMVIDTEAATYSIDYYVANISKKLFSDAEMVSEAICEFMNAQEESESA